MHVHLLVVTAGSITRGDQDPGCRHSSSAERQVSDKVQTTRCDYTFTIVVVTVQIVSALSKIALTVSGLLLCIEFAYFPVLCLFSFLSQLTPISLSCTVHSVILT